jgi:hypothetical protein
MKVVATRDVCYQGKWHKAGDCFECSESDFAGLEVAGVEKYKHKKVEKKDRAIKEVKSREEG